jgi:cell division protein FtsB
MEEAPAPRPRITVIVITFCVLMFAMVNLIISGIWGEHGYLALKNLREQGTLLYQESETLADRTREIENKVNLLRDQTLDDDLLEERAREMLGYARPNELVATLGVSEIAELD